MEREVTAYLYDPIHSLMCLACIFGNICFLPTANHIFIIMKTSKEISHSLLLPEMPWAPTVVICHDIALLKERHKIYFFFGNLPGQTSLKNAKRKISVAKWKHLSHTWCIMPKITPSTNIYVSCRGFQSLFKVDTIYEREILKNYPKTDGLEEGKSYFYDL